ncbi:hypothetical protein LCGC14_2995580 [marine sediment metagenome]|uniref:Uncharacterized protein n=1 Tax=marine sediment metagenome TaxID=412755 RepID=A0A0F8XQ47_9ZZZZ
MSKSIAIRSADRRCFLNLPASARCAMASPAESAMLRLARDAVRPKSRPVHDVAASIPLPTFPAMRVARCLLVTTGTRPPAWPQVHWKSSGDSLSSSSHICLQRGHWYMLGIIQPPSYPVDAPPMSAINEDHMRRVIIARLESFSRDNMLSLIHVLLGMLSTRCLFSVACALLVHPVDASDVQRPFDPPVGGRS